MQERDDGRPRPPSSKAWTGSVLDDALLAPPSRAAALEVSSPDRRGLRVWRGVRPLGNPARDHLRNFGRRGGAFHQDGGFGGFRVHLDSNPTNRWVVECEENGLHLTGQVCVGDRSDGNWSIKQSPMFLLVDMQLTQVAAAVPSTEGSVSSGICRV